MNDTRYGLFVVNPGKGPVQLEIVNGLENGKQRMEQCAAKSPGDYFLYSFCEATIVDLHPKSRNPQ
ncbi:MAG: hypothetical protein WBC04_03290 [Candidatus Acidiferrales bacterium]